MKKLTVFLGTFFLTLAVSGMAQTSNIYSLTDTWNSGTTTYDAIKMTVTDTASAADSKLLNLTATSGGSFIVDKAGNFSITGTATIGAYTLPATDGTAGYYLQTDGAGGVTWTAVAGGGDLKADGTVPLTADWDVGAFSITGAQFESDIVTGTAPLIVASTTVVTNFNADLLDGNSSAAFATAAQGTLADSATQPGDNISTLTNDSGFITSVEGTAVLSTGEIGGAKFLREDGDGTSSWQTVAGGSGAFTADGNTLITPTTPIVLDQATGDEAALTLNYNTNKATSGNDTGLLINQTDTASPGTSLALDVQQGGVSKVTIDNGGKVTLGGAFGTTSGLWYGDGDTGFYEDSDDTIYIRVGGVDRFWISGGEIKAFLAGGPSMLNETATVTNPTLAPWRGDVDSGLGSAGLDQLSLIAGGVEGVRLTETTGTITVDINGAPTIASAYTLPIVDGTNLQSLTTDGAGNVSWVTAAGGGDALVANPLSQFAATTSLQLAGVMSDETGTGAAVFATSPTFVTPILGTPTSGVMTNVTGTASGLTAGNVTTNANLTGEVTSVGNTASLGSFTVASLNTAISDATLSGNNTGDQTNITGNAATVTTNANLAGVVTSTGNATAIADKALAIAKLADGTDGELITWGATGIIETVAVGTATHVLTSNGIGLAPTFQAAAGSASPLTTKGDLYTYDTGDQRLAIGADTFVLTADSAEATGIKWAAATGGGIAAVVDDLTPQLGGDLDFNGFDIRAFAPGSDIATADRVVEGQSALIGATVNTSAGNLDLKMGDHATAGGSAGLVRILAPDDTVAFSIDEDGVSQFKELSVSPTISTNYWSVYGKTDNDLYFQDGAGVEHQVTGIPVFKSYNFSARSAASGEYFLAGYYDHPAADADLTNASPTVTFGSANQPYAAHAFAVLSGAGTTDGTDLILTITGTTINDSGTRNAGGSVQVVTDCTTASLNEYFETSEKWIGQITYTLSSTAGTTFDCTFNYGLAKYEDFGNRGFTLTDFENVGLANATDTGFNIEIAHHRATGWAYSAAAFHPITAANTITSMTTDHGAESDLTAGEPIAYKRAGLSNVIDGADSEGLVIRVTTSVNNSVTYLNAHIGAELN